VKFRGVRVPLRLELSFRVLLRWLRIVEFLCPLMGLGLLLFMNKVCFFRYSSTPAAAAIDSRSRRACGRRGFPSTKSAAGRTANKRHSSFPARRPLSFL